MKENTENTEKKRTWRRFIPWTKEAREARVKCTMTHRKIEIRNGRVFLNGKEVTGKQADCIKDFANKRMREATKRMDEAMKGFGKHFSKSMDEFGDKFMDSIFDHWDEVFKE